MPIVLAPATAEADPEATRRALVVMEREHMKCLEHNNKLEKDLDTATMTIANLENERSTGNAYIFEFGLFNGLIYSVRGAQLDDFKQVICSNMTLLQHDAGIPGFGIRVFIQGWCRGPS